MTNTTTIITSDPLCRSIDKALTIVSMVYLPLIMVYIPLTWKKKQGDFAYSELYIIMLLVTNVFYVHYAQSVFTDFASAQVNDMAIRVLPLVAAFFMVLLSMAWDLGILIAPIVLIVFFFNQYNVSVVSYTGIAVALAIYLTAKYILPHILCLFPCKCCKKCVIHMKYSLRTVLVILMNIPVFCVLFAAWFYDGNTDCTEDVNMLLYCNQSCMLATDISPEFGFYLIPFIIDIGAIAAGGIIALYCMRTTNKKKNKQKDKKKHHHKVGNDSDDDAIVMVPPPQINSDDEFHDVDLDD
jgi:hypothetical protein